MSRLIERETVCLVCLQKGENRFILGKDSYSIVIADKIMKYSDILIKRDTNQPKSICLQCLDDLKVVSKFHRNYEQSESIIKAFLNKNHKEFQIKDLWVSSPTTGIPILDICIKDEVVDNTAIDDGPANTSCYINRGINRDKLNKSLEHTQKESLENEICQIQENTNSNEIFIKHEIVEEDLIGDNCDIESTPSIDVDNGPVSEATNRKIVSLKICEVCNYGFRYQYLLDAHMRRHNNVRPFTCDHCGKPFVTRSDLWNHVRVHTGERPYKCQYCDLRFSHMSVRENHESKHTGEKPFKCPTCDKSFGYSQGLKIHLRIHNKSTCKEFRREKVFKKYANRHLNRSEVNNSSEHTQPKSLDKEIFQIQENTNSNEIIIKHEIVEEDLIGDNCDIESTPSIAVDNGPVSKATNRKIASLKICEVCNYGFRYQYQLDIHMRRHNNVRPFSCDHCGKAFVIREALRRHVRIHTGERPYKCQYCDLRFYSNQVKKSHESKHTGEQLF